VRKWDLDGVIIEATPEKSFAIDGQSSGLLLRFSWEIQEQAGGTRVSLTADASGWLVALFKRKVERALIDDIFTWLYALKTTLERGKVESGEIQARQKPKRRFTAPGPLSFLFKKRSDEE